VFATISFSRVSDAFSVGQYYLGSSRVTYEGRTIHVFQCWDVMNLWLKEQDFNRVLFKNK
jgi:hypothetical protein